LVTATGTVALALKSDARTGIVSCDALTNVACFVAPFQVTVELERKFDPLIVNVNPFVPAAALDGEND
jgi:hypothetical protein